MKVNVDYSGLCSCFHLTFFFFFFVVVVVVVVVEYFLLFVDLKQSHRAKQYLFQYKEEICQATHHSFDENTTHRRNKWHTFTEDWTQMSKKNFF